MGILVGHDMRDTIFVVLNGLRVGIEIYTALVLLPLRSTNRNVMLTSSAVVFPVKVCIVLESVIAVKGHQNLDIVALGMSHEVIQVIQKRVIPALAAVGITGRETLEARVADKLGVLLWRCLPYQAISKHVSCL